LALAVELVVLGLLDGFALGISCWACRAWTFGSVLGSRRWTGLSHLDYGRAAFVLSLRKLIVGLDRWTIGLDQCLEVVVGLDLRT
jgi:hypothetical protein